MRLMTKKSVIYTAMLNENAILNTHIPRERLFGYSPAHKPVVCQLGGNDPEKMAEAAKIVEE